MSRSTEASTNIDREKQELANQIIQNREDLEGFFLAKPQMYSIYMRFENKNNDKSAANHKPSQNLEKIWEYSNG